MIADEIETLPTSLKKEILRNDSYEDFKAENP